MRKVSQANLKTKEAIHKPPKISISSFMGYLKGNNIYNAGSLGALTSVRQSGDVVYAVSCNRLASVRQVYTFARFCHEIQAAESLCERLERYVK